MERVPGRVQRCRHRAGRAGLCGRRGADRGRRHRGPGRGAEAARPPLGAHVRRIRTTSRRSSRELAAPGDMSSASAPATSPNGRRASPTASAGQGAGGMSARRSTLPTRARARLTADAPLAPLRLVQVGRPGGVAVRAEGRRRPRSASSRDLDPAVPVMALGLGSNLIVRDGGVPGVVVRLGKALRHGRAARTPTTLRCGGGAMRHPRLLQGARRRHRRRRIPALIPGTVGGFVRMNGGAYGREVKDILVEARSCCATAGSETLALRRARLHLSPQRAARRRGRRRARPSAAMPGEPAAIQAEMDRIAAAREASQPLRSRTGGSTFKNPPGTKAWQVIDAGRLPGPARSATRRSRRSIATSCSTSARRARAEIEELGEEVQAAGAGRQSASSWNGKSRGWEWTR